MDTFEQILDKLRHFCAYRDRAHAEVRNKLRELKVWGDDADEVIAALITEDYLNEERFARNFARGKFRIKSWGKKKIVQALKAKQVSPYCIRKGLEEIDGEEYAGTLSRLAAGKYAALRHEQYLRRRFKTRQYLLSKGYEPDLVQDAIDALKGENERG